MNVDVKIEEILTKKAFNHVKTVAKQERLPLELAALHALNQVHQDMVSVEIEVEEPVEEPVEAKEPAEEAAEKPDYSEIEALGLTNRAFNSLTQRADVRTIEQLTSMTEEEILDIPYTGEQSLEDIKERLAEHGYSLKGNGPEKEPKDDFDRDESDDFVSVVENWDGDLDDFPGFAAKTLAKAWDVPPKEMLEELRSLFKGVWTRKSKDLEAARRIVISELPATADQMDTVEALADQSDEPLANLMNQKFGINDIGYLTYGQTDQLIDYYNESFEEEVEVEVDDDNFFL